MTSPSFDIRYKLAGLAFALVGAVVVSLTTFFTDRHERAAESALEAKALAYAHLLSRGAESAVAFDDKETTRELFEAAMLDPDLQSMALYGSKGALLGASGEPHVAPTVGDEAVVRRGPSMVSAVSPVISKEGPRGVLVIELSTDAITRENWQTRRAALLAGLAALAAGLVASWVIGGAIASRLRRIQRATQAVAEGNLDSPPVEDSSHDEIGRLATDFNGMAKRIRELVGRVETAAREEKTRLDCLVSERTLQLRQRNDDLKFILDNVGQGFLTVDREGKLAAERSAILETWFGPAGTDTPVWSYVSPCDPDAAQWLVVGWDALFGGDLPVELCLDQLPKEIRGKEATFGIRYQPVFEQQTVSRVVIVISDISEEIARRRAEASQKELAEVFGHVVADVASVEAFMAEGRTLVGSIGAVEERRSPLAEQKRWLHTLKGNAAFLGLSRLSAQCHTMESHLVESGDAPSPKSREVLAELWEEFRCTFEPLVGRRGDRVEVSRLDLARHVAGITEGMSRQTLAHAARSWTLEPAEQRLQRAAAQARSVARSLEKPDLTVAVEANGVRLDAEAWSPFWAAFVHVVRNAVDHGIEGPEARVARGKSTGGTLVLRAMESATETVIEVQDDGKGIDWSKLRERALAMGVTFSDDARAELLFADGLSTKDDVSEFSGRGVGLGAARAACTDMGGRVHVHTSPGAGTRISFHVPRRTTPALRLASSTRPAASERSRAS